MHEVFEDPDMHQVFEWLDKFMRNPYTEDDQLVPAGQLLDPGAHEGGVSKHWYTCTARAWQLRCRSHHRKQQLQQLALCMCMPGPGAELAHAYQGLC